MPDGKVIEITDVNFSETTKSGVTLIDFWAPWCAPCLMQGPIVEKIAQRFGDQAKVGKMNIDSSPNIASHFGIRGIPTLILFKDGQEIKRFVGLQTEEVLAQTINANLPTPVKDTFVKV